MRTYRYAVRFGAATDTGAFLDMMRYDRARVLDWTVETSADRRRSYFRVTLEADLPPTEGRWASFGLIVTPIDPPARSSGRAADESSPTYRRDMKEAGRGGQLP